MIFIQYCQVEMLVSRYLQNQSYVDLIYLISGLVHGTYVDFAVS